MSEWLVLDHDCPLALVWHLGLYWLFMSDRINSHRIVLTKLVRRLVQYRTNDHIIYIVFGTIPIMRNLKYYYFKISCFLYFYVSNNGINFNFFKLLQTMILCHHSNFYVFSSTLDNLKQSPDCKLYSAQIASFTVSCPDLSAAPPNSLPLSPFFFFPDWFPTLKLCN